MERIDYSSHNPSLTRSKSYLMDNYVLFEQLLKKCDQHLLQYSLVQWITTRFNLRPCYIPLVSVLFASLLLGFFDNFITNAVGFFYPAWQSFKVIENPVRKEDTQWLVYWIVFGFFTVVEPFGGVLLFWIPYYHLFKISFLLWLFLPQFKGASLFYKHLIRPFLLQYETQIDSTFHRVAETAVHVASSIQVPDEPRHA